MIPLGKGPVVEGVFFAPKIAGDVGGIGSCTGQGACVQAAGSNLYLGYATVRKDCHFLSAALAVALLLIGLPVVEDIPLTVH